MMSTYLAKKTAELAYNVRNEYEEWTLALGSKAQASMTDIIEMSFISMYKLIGPSCSSCPGY
jgi:hypothetical protein